MASAGGENAAAGAAGMKEEEMLLLRVWRLVDAAYCFLSRHRATMTVKSVLQMANSLSRSSSAGGANDAIVVTHEQLRQLARIAPSVIDLRSVQQTQLLHRDDIFRKSSPSPEELELVVMPTIPQISQRAMEQRLRLITKALKENPVVDTEPVKTVQVETPASREISTMKQSGTMDATVKKHASDVPSSPWIERLRGLDIYKDQIVHVERRPSRNADRRPLKQLELPEALTNALAQRGIDALYSHQFESISATKRGDNVVLSTSTASGKSLAFNIPTLTALLEDPSSTFLYLFPTKALAQDQLKSLRRLLVATGLREDMCATFDGDTPMRSRTAVVRDTHIFLTNPDIMHLSILPKHKQWRRVLTNLKLLVVDEAHMYRGVFGSHVAGVFRRLFRLCAHYGANPRVICCSATIKNPTEHFKMLVPRLPPRVEDGGDSEPRPANFDFFFERPLTVITRDGAPTGEKLFVVWNPKAHQQAGEDSDQLQPPTMAPPSEDVAAANTEDAEVTPKPAKRRRRNTAKPLMSSSSSSTNAELSDEEASAKRKRSVSSIFHSAKIFARLVEDQIHTIMFCKGRKLAELVLMSVHSVLQERDATKELIQRVHTYRGGYSAEDRRRIEQRLFSGELLGVVATNALELGIDIGELDCTMHLGLPGTIASLWQQAGRAGRQHTQQSLAVIVCFDAPLDQHFARHGAELFALDPEAVGLNPANVKVLSPHLVCAANEIPLYDKLSGMDFIDQFVLGATAASLLPDLVAQQLLFRQSAGDGEGYRVHSCAPKSIRSVSLRSISEIVYQVVTDDGALVILDEIPGELVFFQVYPTAVYLHQGQEYIITRLDMEQRVAYARRCPRPLTYYTTCRDFTDVDVVKVQRRTVTRSLVVCEGLVTVTTSVFGSTLVEKRSMRVLHVNEFSLPPMQSAGHAVWLELPHSLRVDVEAAGYVWPGALHGVGHLLLAVIPLFVLCDAGDINTEHVNPFERRPRYVPFPFHTRSSI
ncbi:hypothetical protein PINS_up005469 [Pythium insidiosum]|nr:hypothetical protein PINS_up005469 [Pythium insidiosum]